MSDALLPEQQRALDYLARKGTDARVEVLRAQAGSAFAEIEAAFDAVPFEVRDRAPAAGKWSAREILDHLVLSHGPAVPQLASLATGVDPSDGAIPADLHREASERPGWDDLRAQLGDIHRALLALIRDDAPLTARVAIEMVVKVDGQPLRWTGRFDWKAFVQGIRVHTLEHHRQLQRTVA